MSKRLKIILTIILVVLLFALVGATFAYFYWQSDASDVSLETENISLVVDGGDDIVGESLVPVDNRSKGIVKDFTITNENDFNVYVTLDFFINSIDEELIEESFVYELYKVDDEEETLVRNGNLSSAEAGERMDLTRDYFNIKLNASQTKAYRLYLYIDGTVENPSDMKGKSFNLTLEALPSSREYNSSEFLINKAISKSDLNSLSTGSYRENGDFLVINRAPLGADYQVNVQQYEYRYVGASPSNYVWFNCSATDTNSHVYGTDEYEYNTTNCEKWRIIGVFLTEVPVYDDNSNIISYKWQYLTKIIKNDSIGSLSWDSKGTYGSNDWYTSRLMKTLNPGFETNDEDSDGVYESNSLYYNRQSGTCFSGSNSAEKTCNFTSSGLKTETKNYIESVKWYLGGQNSNNYTEYFYLRERSTNKYSSNTDVNWTGQIGLMYPSDYGYAAGSVCAMDTSRVSYNNSNGDYRGCVSTNWMYNSYEWMLSPSSARSDYVSYVYPGGYFNYDSYAFFTIGVRPVLYLKSSVSISGGAGTESEPYTITMN